MKRMDNGKHRKWLALLLILALLTAFLPPQQTEAQGEVPETEEITEGTDYGLSNPELGGSAWDTKTWDCVYFGHYWQSDTNDDGIADKEDAKEPILWRVLSVDGDDAFLLAECNLELKKYNEQWADVTWETSEMRSWLNGYDGDANQCGTDYTGDNFLDDAFSPSEQAAIRETNVENRDNWIYKTEGGNDTTDRVYLLSMIEAITEKYGFHTQVRAFTDTRRAKDTEYVWEMSRKNLKTGNSMSIYRTTSWWLRSSGAPPSNLDKDQYETELYPSERAVLVRQLISDDQESQTGYISADGQLSNQDMGVRPVLHLDLSQRSCWTYAGTVSAQPLEENLLPAPEPEETPVRSEQPAQTPDPSFPGTNDTPVPPVTGDDGVMTWDCVYFGRYWQNDTNQDGRADRKDAKEKIKWRVLSVDGDDVLLLADKVIAFQPYNETWVDVTWATSTMRSWLNGYDADANLYGKNYTHNNFLDYAFSASEQLAIKDTALVNADDDKYGTEGGEDTTDKVYLLSKNDMVNSDYGFSEDLYAWDKNRCTTPTKYVVTRGAGGCWWLRSPGDGNKTARTVSSIGVSYGDVDDVQIGVRPALHLNISCSSCWSNAGKVTSDGKVMEPVVQTPSATPSAEPTVTGTPTESEKPMFTATPSAEPTATQKPTGDPTATGTPAESEKPVPVATPSAKPTVTQKPTGGPIVTGTPAESEKPTSAATPSAKPSVTQKPTGGPTATGTPAESGKPVQPGSQTTAVIKTTETKQPLSPGKVTGLKLKAKKQVIQVSWKKCSGAKGYEIWYSTSKKWKKKKGKVTKKTKLKIRKLKSKKVYYVRVRAYTVQNGKKRYGKWSKTVKKRCR